MLQFESPDVNSDSVSMGAKRRTLGSKSKFWVTDRQTTNLHAEDGPRAFQPKGGIRSTYDIQFEELHIQSEDQFPEYGRHLPRAATKHCVIAVSAAAASSNPRAAKLPKTPALELFGRKQATKAAYSPTNSRVPQRWCPTRGRALAMRIGTS